MAGATPQGSPIEYLSPRPSSSRVSQNATLILRFDRIDPATITNLRSFLSARGATSGPIRGDTRIASDGRTIIFSPANLFLPGEEVSVRLRAEVGIAGAVLDSSYAFVVLDQEEATSLRPPQRPSIPLTGAKTRESWALSKSGDPVILNGVSVPSDFPFMQVIESDEPSDGYLFLNNWGGQPYNMILDNTGAPVWYWRTPDRRRDFKVQPDGRLTMLIRDGYGGSGEGHIALDSTYTVVDTMRAGGGYLTDEHELTVLPNGHYFLIGRRDTRVDMSQFVAGGRTNAIVSETTIQEFTPEGEMIFLWRSWDHYDIRDLQIDDLRGAYIRFPHMNSISIDEDGHILVSCRHLSEVTKINRQTGEIIWRLGGAHNQFTWVNDPFGGFSAQHDFRALGNNRYTVFDNGNGHQPPETRAVEYEIDPQKMTATVVWQYRHDPKRYTYWMGNAQRLPNGNTQINYADGSLPKIVEVRPDGSKALEMDFEFPAHCYRSFKFNWKGKAVRPYLIIENSSTAVTLLFNKFGDPAVDHYNVYAGLNPNPTEIIASSEKPFIHLTELQNQERYYFRITAVDYDGAESPFSNEESALVNLVERGANMVLNGDFDGGNANWDYQVSGNAQAAVYVGPDGVLHFDVTEGGADIWNVQARQTGLPLLNGRKYRFEFDAYADRPRVFEAKVIRDGDPWTNYGRIGLTSLTTRNTHFTYDFAMERATDFQARLELNAGGQSGNVYVDNVSLSEIVSTDTELPEQAGPVLTVHPTFPNPFRGESQIRYDIGEAAWVTVQVFDVTGRLVRLLDDRHRSPGSHTAAFDAQGLAPGTYLLRVAVRARSGDGAVAQQLTYMGQ